MREVSGGIANPTKEHIYIYLIQFVSVLRHHTSLFKLQNHHGRKAKVAVGWEVNISVLLAEWYYGEKDGLKSGWLGQLKKLCLF